jgi:hypothetical protein
MVLFQEKACFINSCNWRDFSNNININHLT